MTISRRSMVRARRLAIGLYDYSRPVMVARTNYLAGGRSRLGGRRRMLGYVTLLAGGKYTSSEFTVPSSADPRDRFSNSASGRNGREEARLAALAFLGAARPEADHVLQELVDEVRGVYGPDLCMINLNLRDVQYFRAWSGDLEPDLAEARQDDLDRSMCRYVVDTERPLVVEDFLATEEFREQHWCVNYGIRFYAGTPLITSGGDAIGTLCLLSTEPLPFGDEQMRVLGAFARAAVGRLELLGALEREQAAKEAEAQRGRELQQTLDSLSAHIAILDEGGEIVAVNSVWRQFAESNGGNPEQVAEGANYLLACDGATGENADEAAVFARGVRDVLSGEKDHFELEYPCHSPTERRWFIGRVTPYERDGRSWAVVAHENITARRMAEEALRDQKVLLETILGQAADAIIVCDERGRFTFANAAAKEMALMDPEGTTLECTPEVWGVAHFPDGRPVPLEEWSISRALRNETTVGREKRMIRPDGDHCDVLISAAPLKNVEGEIVGAVAGLLDITERKRAEEESPFIKSVESLVELNRQLTPERGISLRIEEGFPERLSGEMSVELLRVLQEALANARRHSRATKVEVSLRTEGEAVLAGGFDHGRGLHP